jgi:hypothetical protein
MPNFNPFKSESEDTSFEQGMPVNRAVKNITKATASQIKKANDDFAKAMRDQLYGSSSPQDQNTDNAANPLQAAGSQGKQQGTNNTSNTNRSPEEQVKMEKIRHELFGNYAIQFKSAPNTAGINNASVGLDQELERERKKREQEEQQRKQDEEEEEQRKKEEKEKAKQEEVLAPAGKKTGFMLGKKQQQPIAVQLARTKTEVNRGTMG